MATWNVRTLLCTEQTTQRRTAIVGFELKRYDIEIAPLCESRFSETGSEEKCIEQQRHLLAVFIDLTKAFDTVNLNALWQVLTKKGIPTKIVNILKSLHNGMLGTVKINVETTDSFPISTGVKQGCTIAPTLFIIYFDTMLKEALRNCNEGIYVRVRTDGSLFNLARLRAHTKTRIQLVQELLYVDDCGIFAHCDTVLQNLMQKLPSSFMWLRPNSQHLKNGSFVPTLSGNGLRGTTNSSGWNSIEGLRLVDILG